MTERRTKLLGYLSISAGVTGFLVAMSPIFPVFAGALIFGAVFIGIGFWILAGRDLRASLRRAAKAYWSSRGGGRRGPPPVDRLLPVRILKLAKKHDGLLTVSIVAMDLNIPLDVAEAGLEECVRAGNAIPDFDIPRSHKYYEFPEFLRKEEQRAPDVLR